MLEKIGRGERGDALGFLGLADNEKSVELVVANTDILLDRGIYEEAVLHALIAPRTNHHRVEMGLLHEMIRVANKEKLRAAGDPLPGSGPFTLYRGIAGIQRYRRIRGISWTGSFDQAVWFAGRFQPDPRLPDPAVYKAVVEAEHVLARITERKEDEYIVLLPTSLKVTRTDWRHEQRELACVAHQSFSLLSHEKKVGEFRAHMGKIRGVLPAWPRGRHLDQFDLVNDEDPRPINNRAKTKERNNHAIRRTKPS